MEFSDILNLAPLFKILAKKQLMSHRICRITLIGCHNFVLMHLIETLKWYYDQKITFIFSSDFETMFVKHSPSEIISVNFEKKTVNLNCNFPV